jgi:DedD protein
MDAALKQRLVGAAVLVALAVIFLPMLVDGPDPQAGTSSVPLDIPPAPERDFETRELPLAAPADAGQSPLAAPVDPNQVVTVETDSPERADALPEQDPVAVTPSEPIASAGPATEPAQPPVAAPETASVEVPEVAPAAPAVTPGGRFVVNLGSYGNAANASGLVATLKAAKLPAYAEAAQLDGKAVQRVRLGPYAQRGEAEAARLAATRVRADLPAAVVALDNEAAAAAPAPVREPVASGFAVQIGALKTEADANALRTRARNAGFTAFVERTSTDAGVLWRVRVGPEIVRANAEKLKSSIAAKLQIDGMVVTHP